MTFPVSRTARLVALLIAGVFYAAPGYAAQPRIAIIIDDLGYQYAAGKRAIQLPGPVSYAVLPKTPQAVVLAELAHAAGKDVLLHQPLQPNNEHDVIDPGTIDLEMSHQQLATTLASNLASVPYVVGINNHRGSLLTRHPGHMQWLMEEINSQGGLFFLDSYTTHQSVALQLAHENGVPAIKRDVFLDNDPSPEAISKQFDRLKHLALRNGMAVGIGHPFAATLDVLERELPLLEAQGFLLVGVRPLVADLAREQLPQPSDSGDIVAD
jgi:polysaccharide deacetylase 2 family uncharacterized protein YibQ